MERHGNAQGQAARDLSGVNRDVIVPARGGGLLDKGCKVRSRRAAAFSRRLANRGCAHVP